jgi:D-aminopeptidase
VSERRMREDVAAEYAVPGLVSSGDKNLLERRAVELPSAARSRERKEQSSLVAAGDESPNGLVNWGAGSLLG